jgi:uncharacterized iron-regulated membrane protein
MAFFKKSLSISPEFSKSMLSAHSLIGIIFGAMIYLVCFSGTLAVMFGEFTLWEAPEEPFVTTEDITPELLAKVGEAALVKTRETGFEHAIYVVNPTPELPRLTITGYKETGDWRQWVADKNGTLYEPPATGWSDFLRLHHYNFHLPGMIGYYIVGLVGCLLIASLASGVIAHRRILKDAFRLRLGGSRRLSSADMHNRVAVWALPFHLIVSLTGSLLGLASLILGFVAFVAYDGNEEKAWEILFPVGATEDHTPAPLTDIRTVLDDLEARRPGSEVVWVGYDHAGTAGQAVLIATAEEGYLTRSEMWTYTGEGKFRTKIGYTDGSVGMRIYGMLVPLHFGTYGGLALKIIYMLLGMGLSGIVATGINTWLARKRDQGFAKPHWERVWGTLVWGQIPAFAIAALFELWGLAPALLVYWALTLIPAAAVGPISADFRIVTRTVQLIGGISLLTLAAAHAIHWGAPMAESILIDLAIATLGLLLIRMAHKSRMLEAEAGRLALQEG